MSESLEQSPPPLPFESEPKRAYTVNFQFKGRAGEYFGIWIVNLALTIITLTLYAPWAKVRRLRYFYGHTLLEKHNFDYTALPTRILVGRLIALALYFGFYLMTQFSAEFYLVGLILLMLAVPWLIRSSLRFTARNSKYGNVRFRFGASMGESYKVFLGAAAITIVSFGFLFPIALWWFKRYQIGQLSVGQHQFKFNASLGSFFLAILIPSLIFYVALIVSIVFLVVAFFVLKDAVGLAVFMFAGFYIASMFYLGPLIKGYIFKATWNHVSVADSPLQTTLSPWRYAWISMTNTFARILSLGLLSAWAAIRIYRYKVESMSITFYDDPSRLITQTQEDYNAIGEEVADLFDLDISL